MSSLQKRESGKLTTQISDLSSIPIVDKLPYRERGSRTFLTVAESQIMLLIANGYKAKQVAATLNRPLHSINGSIEGMRQRFEAANTPHLVAICFRRGWLS